MLNLVIALISDAYEEVMNSITEQDAFDTNLMIIEAEIFYFWKRKAGEACYLYFADYATEKLIDWKSQVTYVTQTITSAQDSMKNEMSSQLAEVNNSL